MAPQTDIPVAANVLGTIGTGFGVFRIWTNWRTKQTDGLPGVMMFLWAVCGVPFGTYAVIQNFNIPIQVQPQAFMGLCLISWTQILIYNSKWRVWTATLFGLGVAALFAGVQAALILTLRPVYEAGNEAPALVVGILASVLLAAGLIPPYFEIYKRRGRVVGINFIFLGMDWCGAFFSLMAVVTQNTFDILGGVLYSICALLEIGIFLSHIIWLLRTRELRRQAKAEGKTFDELAAERIAEVGAAAFPFAERPLHRCFSLSWWQSKVLGRTATKSGDEEAVIVAAVAAAPAAEPKPVSDSAAGGAEAAAAAEAEATVVVDDDDCRSCCSGSAALKDEDEKRQQL